jgi:hypothetical protein
MAKLIGTDPNQVPTNGDLGDLAYQNKESVKVESLTVDADGVNALTVNRDTSDGDIVLFRKDGTTVGSIGTNTGDIWIGTDDTGLRFHDNIDMVYPINPATGTSRDNAINLGHSGGRFKDLYLSGGVYLGGTGSANYLDDYEEGTWTPALSGHTLTIEKAQYTKVGRQVHLFAQLTSNSSTTVEIDTSHVFTGIPFTPDSSSPRGVGGTVQWYGSHGESKNALGDMIWNNAGLDTEIIVVRGTFTWADCISITLNVTYNTTA